MFDDAFVLTNPHTVIDVAAFRVNHPSDQPSYVGLVFNCVNAFQPFNSVQYTLRLSEQQASDLMVDLLAAGIKG